MSGPRLLVCISLLAAGGASIAAYRLPAAWLAAFVLFALAPGCFFTGKRNLPVLLLALVPVLFWAFAVWRTPAPGQHDLSVCASSGVIFQARISEMISSEGSSKAERSQGQRQPNSESSESQIRETTTPKRVRVLVDCQELIFPHRRKLEGKSIVAGVLPPGLQVGDQVEIRGRLRPPAVAVYPWQFNYKEYLARRGIFCLCSAQSMKVLRRSRLDASTALFYQFAYLIDGCRDRITEAHRQWLGSVKGDLLSSMVLGERSLNLSENLRQEFRDVGLSHLLAASGFNLSLVTGMTWWIGRLVCRSPWVLNCFCLGAMAVFVLLAGPSQSVVRAAIMIGLLLFSRCLFRTLHAPAALAFALLATLLVDPLSVTDVGLQLSYCATAGIICGVNHFSVAIAGSPRSLVRWLLDTILIVVLAQASVLPLQLMYFWQIGLFFLPANLLVSPLVPLITVLGFVSSCLAMPDCQWVSPLIAALDKLAMFPLSLMLQIVNYLSSFQAAKLCLGPPLVASVIIYYLAFTALLVCLRAGRFRILSAAIWLVTIAMLLYRPALPTLTIACLKEAIILMDSHRNYLCVGDSAGGQARRFLSYFGAKPAQPEGDDFVLTPEGSGRKITCKSTQLSLGIIESLPCTMSACSALLIKKSILNGKSCARGRIHRQSVEEVVNIVKASGASVVVLETGRGRAGRMSSAVVAQLCKLSELQVVREQGDGAILVTGGPDNMLASWPGLSNSQAAYKQSHDD